METTEFFKHDSPTWVDVSLIAALEHFTGDHICYQIMGNDNKNKTISSSFDLSGPHDFNNWNFTSIGNLKMIAYHHHNNEIRDKAWKLLTDYYKWTPINGIPLAGSHIMAGLAKLMLNQSQTKFSVN